MVVDKLQRLKSQLYISDNSDLEEIIDDSITNAPTRQRHTRKRERIDYNENKRIPLYTTVTPNNIQRQSVSKSQLPEKSTASNIITTKPQGVPQISTASNYVPILSDFKETNLIDNNFLKRIVEFDLNKKLSVLGDSDLQSINTQTDHIDDYDESFYNLEESTDSSSPPPLPILSIDDFTDEINNEIKIKYELFSNSIIYEKQRKIESTISTIDSELHTVSLKYHNFKNHILHSRKSKKFNHLSPFNHKPTLYPNIFKPQFKKTDDLVNIENKKLNYQLNLNHSSSENNKKIIMNRHIHSFIENRESMKRYLLWKIAELDKELQVRMGDKNLSEISAILDWNETNKLVKKAEEKLNQ
jgi:hypothetical protein